MSELVSDNALQIRGDDIVIILGRRRAGKSNLIAWMISNFNLEFIILDVVGNFTFLKSKQNVQHFIVDPDDEKRIDNILKLSSGKTVVVDEADLYHFNSGNLLSKLLNIGRNYGVGFIVSARRPANISKNLLSNADEVFIFDFKEPRDVEYLQSWLASGLDYRIKSPYAFRLFVNGEDRGLYQVNRVI